ncbi:hypothetical protein HMPREF9629_00433 [Peptoanaerobacter stomatis]|uniref:T4 recombination endonuclease VII dimerisation domain-containing protein n=1 Tax=Peptoanaerobacter stomatis TaxID=796937 RepID=G9X210_9FIRM|nr:hypothetical protein [Peptoanaerobacter stomatis]EHL13133.1 hypothetical protein HMPREF9629_00433 [Peptoanaerobacter stomatis]
MRYRNTKTGAVIDSPCTISGGDWIVYDENEVIQDKQDENKKDDNEENQEQEESDEVAELSKKEIMQELDALGIKYNPKANKQELYDLMMKGR